MWSAYRRFGGPDLPSNLTGVDFIMDAPYPATVPVPKGSVRLADVMNIMRDYYEGTPFDMTVGMAAGPFGSPDRFGSNKNVTGGGWERTIATHHSIVSLVMEARSWLPDPIGGTLWFAPHAAHTSTYAPFPCGMDTLPASYSNGSGWGVPDKGVAAWANRAVFSAVQVRFKDAMVDLVATRAKLDNASMILQKNTDAAFKAGTTDMQAVGALFSKNADAIVASWWALHDLLIHTVTKDSGYPEWWLTSSDVNYVGGPAAQIVDTPATSVSDSANSSKQTTHTAGSASNANPNPAECVRLVCGGSNSSVVDVACVMRCIEPGNLPGYTL
jgi:dipeptidase